MRFLAKISVELRPLDTGKCNNENQHRSTKDCQQILVCAMWHVPLRPARLSSEDITFINLFFLPEDLRCTCAAAERRQLELMEL